MDSHPFLNHGKFMVCLNQIMQCDLASLYLNTFFSMAFVALIPCICVVWGFIAAPNKMSLLSVLKSISLKTRMCVYPIIYPLLTYKGVLPLLVGGWFHLLVSSSKIYEVVITSPATFPWTTYAGRNRPHFEWNYVELAHSPFTNHYWVKYEPYKDILLQNLDFIVYNYILLCTSLLLWSFYAFQYENILYMATHNKTRKFTQCEVTQSFGNILHGPFVKTWMYVTSNKNGRFPFWVPRFIEGLILLTDVVLFSPGFVLLIWLPVLSILYRMELNFDVTRTFSRIPVDDPNLQRVLERLEQLIQDDGPGVYPVHYFVAIYAEHVHAFWKLVGLMQ